MITQLNPQRFGGYDLFLRAGAPPVPGVDLPVARLDSSVNQASQPEAPLGLQPDTMYFGSVWAFNLSGRAAQAAEFRFMTDGDGHPLQVPTPVTGLSARPIAGGAIVVQWEYDELGGLVVADNFQVTVQELRPPGGLGFGPSPVMAADVPHTPPKRQYRVTIDAPSDGPSRVRVRPYKGVATVFYASGVDVMADSAAPAAGIVALGAV